MVGVMSWLVVDWVGGNGEIGGGGGLTKEVAREGYTISICKQGDVGPNLQYYTGSLCMGSVVDMYYISCIYIYIYILSSSSWR